MNQGKQKSIKNQRIFHVGIIGASNKEASAIRRIFAVTNFRKRCYSPKVLNSDQSKKNNNVDFFLMCTDNPFEIEDWRRSQYCKTPPIFLSRNPKQNLGKYQLSSPVNPGKFVQILDHYTIKELNYFPEFEIGSEDTQIDKVTISGLKILRSNLNSNKNPNDPQRSILIVDDSLAVRRQMKLEFQLRSDHLDVASNAEDAIFAIQSKRYDLIFLDVVMPGMDGYAACKKIKKDRRNHNTPVVLLTSRSSSFDKIKGALAGCDAYLVKPINHNEFEDVYDRFTQHSTQGDRAHAS